MKRRGGEISGRCRLIIGLTFLLAVVGCSGTPQTNSAGLTCEDFKAEFLKLTREAAEVTGAGAVTTTMELDRDITREEAENVYRVVSNDLAHIEREILDLGEAPTNISESADLILSSIDTWEQVFDVLIVRFDLSGLEALREATDGVEKAMTTPEDWCP